MYFHLLPVPILGLALLWSLQLVFARQKVNRDSPIILFFTVSAWVLIYLGVGLVFGPIVFVLALIVGGMVVARYRYAERRTLLWLLAIAAEADIPLSEAADAYAQGRIDEMGSRAASLARQLQMGVPLPLALEHSRNPLPTDGELAARLGYATDTLATTLREAAQDQDQLSESSHLIYGTLLYFAAVILVALGIVTFISLQVFPAFGQIMIAFDTQIPWPIAWMASFLHAFNNFFFLLLPFVLLVGGLLAYALIAYLGFRLPSLPIIGRLNRRCDTAVIVRSIGSGVAQGRSIPESIDLLAQWYPAKSVAAKLAQANERLQSGVNWCDSLVELRLIGLADAAVLKSAQRAGNLEWACRELAETIGRRIRHRAARISRLLLPLLAIGVGLPIAIFAVAIILPLAQIVGDLSQ